MKTKILALLLLTAGALVAETRIFLGFGGYVAPPPPVAYVAPPPVAYVAPYPGPGYLWVPGYWYYSGPHRYWRAGYWAPRYYRPYRVVPRGHWRGHEYRHGWRR